MNGTPKQAWEYLEVYWTQQIVTVTIFSVNNPTSHQFDAGDWPRVFAQLGAEGWELVNAIASPTGMQEYWFYFKRPGSRSV